MSCLTVGISCCFILLDSSPHRESHTIVDHSSGSTNRFRRATALSALRCYCPRIPSHMAGYEVDAIQAHSKAPSSPQGYSMGPISLAPEHPPPGPTALSAIPGYSAQTSPVVAPRPKMCLNWRVHQRRLTLCPMRLRECSMTLPLTESCPLDVGRSSAAPCPRTCDRCPRLKTNPRPQLPLKPPHSVRFLPGLSTCYSLAP